MKFKPANVVLKDGSVFSGEVPSWQEGEVVGEVVFTTGMMGYLESLTDPSYAGQLLVFTYPLLGNYGVLSEENWESDRIHASGVILSEACENYSHSGAKWSFLEWLKDQKIPCIVGVDTRELTKKIREEGALLGAITAGISFPENGFQFESVHLVSEVSIKHGRLLEGKGKRVVAVDCGMKANILRNLESHGVEIHHVPFDYDFTKEEYDGVFVSNGPGNPEMCTETIHHLKKAMEKGKPIFGICLGAQLLALAAGAKTYKLRYGHRGHNQPCMDLRSERCYMTSQNHGYAVDEQTLPQEWEVSFRNLNDGTVEGIRHKNKPFWAVQFHPEAAPGPTDTQWIFEEFIGAL